VNQYCLSSITGSFLSRHYKPLYAELFFHHYWTIVIMISTNIDIRFSNSNLMKLIAGLASCCRPHQNSDYLKKTINAWTNERTAVSSVCFVIRRSHNYDISMRMSMPVAHLEVLGLDFGLDILHTGKTVLKVFSFFVIAVNGYSFIRIDWHHHLTLTLNCNLKISFPHRRHYISRMQNSLQVICLCFLKGHTRS